ERRVELGRLQKTLKAGRSQAEHDLTKRNHSTGHCFWPDLEPRASRITAMNLRVRSVTALKSPVFAPAVKLPPTPSAILPAAIHSAALSIVTPPVGISEACGSGARAAFTKAGPSVSPGKILTISTPHSRASTISPIVPAPGKYGI